jgi:hypothetical protein
VFLFYNLLKWIFVVEVFTLEGYSAMTPQPIAILTSYGTLRRYNIKLLQPIVISTAYSTLGTLQRKASTTNSHSSSLEHYWGKYSEKPLQPIYVFQKSTTYWGDTTLSL